MSSTYYNFAIQRAFPANAMYMVEKLIKHFSKISPLSDEEQNAIISSVRIEEFEKGTILLKAGQVVAETYFVLKGCIREYFPFEGEEKTTNFFTEDQWAIPFNSLTPNNPATFFWVCAENTAVAIGNEREAQEIFKQFPRFETISRAVMEVYFTEQKRILTTYLTDTPEQRYLKLVESRPDLVQRVPLYQLASYLGIKPESLSRIRKRMAQNPNRP